MIPDRLLGVNALAVRRYSGITGQYRPSGASRKKIVLADFSRPIRSEFDRLIAVLMAHTYVSMLAQSTAPGLCRTASNWANGLNLPGEP
jgi:hypothetical protein